MKTKGIVFTAPGVAELLEREVAAPAVGEVLVRLEVSTISSGTERANVVGEAAISIHSHAPVSFPRVAGYSSAGVVEQVGEGVTKVAPGDRVALSWSTHTRLVCLPEGNVHKIGEESLSFSEAALLHIATFPLAAIRKCRLEIGESAVVMGLGILGLMAVQLLRIAGAVPVIAVDPVASRRETALRLGADYALDPFAPDFTETVRRITGGVKVAIEVTGVGMALNQVLDVMAPLGRVALLGCTRHSDFTVDYYRKVHGPGISLIGAHTNARPVVESSAGLWTTGDDVQALMRLIAVGRLDLAALVQDTRLPEEAGTVYARLINEKEFPITQFDWRNIE